MSAEAPISRTSRAGAVEAADRRRAPPTPRPGARAPAAGRSGSTPARSRASPRRAAAASASGPGSGTGPATRTGPTSPTPASPSSPRRPSARPGSPTRTRTRPRRIRRASPPRSRGCATTAVAGTETAEVIELAKRIERVALDRDERVTGVEEVVYVDEDGDAAIATSRGVSGQLRRLGRLLVPAGDGDAGLGGPDRARLRRRALAAIALDPEQIGAEAGDEASLDARRDQARVAHLPRRALRARHRELRRLHRRRRSAPTTCSAAARRSPTGSATSSRPRPTSWPTTASIPGGLASAPFDGEGTPRGRTPLIADGKLLAYLHDSYTARRGGADSTGNAARASYRLAPSVSTSNLVLEPGELTLEQLLERAQRRRLRHRGRRPPFGRQPGDRPLLGRGLRAGDPRRRARRAAARVHDRG